MATATKDQQEQFVGQDSPEWSWQNDDAAVSVVQISRVDGMIKAQAQDALAVEGPLEIRLQHGPRGERQERSISVTMRTPGSDRELAVGFLYTEGVIREHADIASDGISFVASKPNTITVSLDESTTVSTATLERNFYMTSSCGICGKASILALRSVCPPRYRNTFTAEASMLFELPRRLRAAQEKFDRTGGVHAAGLFNAQGELEILREDVGRHNAVDKLIGTAALAGRLPLREHILLLSGRVSFELLQKAVMAGIPMIVAIGAPSSLAVQVAREFDITLAGFLRDAHFNIYNGSERIRVNQASPQETP
jgi:FdhD protein